MSWILSNIINWFIISFAFTFLYYTQMCQHVDETTSYSLGTQESAQFVDDTATGLKITYSGGTDDRY